eukprot:scaffold1406_cov284-Chaetoceros_neogracile.AAC.7
MSILALGLVNMKYGLDMEKDINSGTTWGEEVRLQCSNGRDSRGRWGLDEDDCVVGAMRSIVSVAVGAGLMKLSWNAQDDSILNRQWGSVMILIQVRQRLESRSRRIVLGGTEVLVHSTVVVMARWYNYGTYST